MIQFRAKAKATDLCKWTDLGRSSFYYKPHPGPRGMKPSTQTQKGTLMVDNAVVVEEIRAVLGQDYCLYGYHIMTDELRFRGYHINDKKVYRLMDENRLLCGKVIRCKGKRAFVQYRRIKASRPLEYLCLDLKYIWVTGERKWYYQLAIMDVFSRKILCWILQSSVKQTDVIALMRHLDLKFGLKGVIIRNDNGSQFIAHKVRQTLQDLEAKQEFTHVATPEENAYIESFHSIQQRELIDRFDFLSYYDAKQHIEKYMHWYNTIRRHGQLKGMTPDEKWAQGMSGLAVKQPFKAAWQHQSRPADAYENYLKHQPPGLSLDGCRQADYLCLTGEQDERGLLLNLLNKNVQFIGG